MKVQVLQESFSKALSLSAKFVSTRSQLPILSNVVIKADKTKLTLLATNLESSIAASIGAKVEEVGQLALPARTLSDLISNLPKGQIQMESQGEQLNLRTDNLNSQLVGMNVQDFPIIPEALSSSAVNIDSRSFIHALNSVLFATSVDETRPVLTGVLVLFENNNLVLVATDGFRLSQKRIPVENLKDSGKTILPRSTLMELSRIAGFGAQTDEAGKLSLEIKTIDNQVLFGIHSKTSDVVLTSRVIEGDFPPYERIIPKSSTLKVFADRQEFLQAVKLSLVLARDVANVGKLKIEEGRVSILVESAKSGVQTASFDAKVEGGSLEVLYNLRFIEEFLNAVEGEEIELSFNDSASAGIFKEVSDPQFLHLIMPVKI